MQSFGSIRRNLRNRRGISQDVCHLQTTDNALVLTIYVHRADHVE